MSRMTMMTPGSPTTLPLADLLTIIPSLPRPLLSRLVTRMIDHMDAVDGDPDLEDTGEDDEDTHDREQEHAYV